MYPNNSGVLANWTLYVNASKSDTNPRDRCDNPTTLSTGDGTRTVTGNTSCAQEDYLGSCGGTGRDAVYKFALAAPKHVKAEIGAGKNWVLYLRAANGTTCSGVDTACDVASADKLIPPRLEADLPAGTWYLFVDSNGDAASYTLKVTFGTVLPNGSSCSDAEECASGYCVDGVCCNAACDGLCLRCDGKDTAGGTADLGKCKPVKDAKDPDNECLGSDSICGGVCNGTGDCRKPGTDVMHKASGVGGNCQRCDGQGSWEYAPDHTDPFNQCVDRYCSGNKLYYAQACSNDPAKPADKGKCDCWDPDLGIHGCLSGAPNPTNRNCPGGYTCDPYDGPDPDSLADNCRTSCTDQSGCVANLAPTGYYCEERESYMDDGSWHTCVARKGKGVVCEDPPPPYSYSECAIIGAAAYSCQDGVCCTTLCAGQCRSCAVAGKLGTCTNLPGDSTPDPECQTSDPTLCGQGRCDGLGACNWPDGSTACHAATCGTDNDDGSPAAAWLLFPADLCNDQGYCLDGGYQACPEGLVCDAAGQQCAATCTSDLECSRPFAGGDCDPAGTAANYQCQAGDCVPIACSLRLDPDSGGAASSAGAGLETRWGTTGKAVGAAGCQGAGCGVGKPAGAGLGFFPGLRAQEPLP